MAREGLGWVKGAAFAARGSGVTEVVRELTEATADIPEEAELEARGAALSAPARCALATALYDLQQRVDTPPGTSERPRFARCNATLVAGEPTAVAADAERWASAGFSTFKLKLGTSGGDDVGQVRAVRAAIDPMARIRVDANGAWSVEEAVRVLKEIEPFDVELAEQPVATMVELAQVAAESPIPIAADESVTTLIDAERAKDSGACAIVGVKLSKVGGVAAASEIAGSSPLSSPAPSTVRSESPPRSSCRRAGSPQALRRTARPRPRHSETLRFDDRRGRVPALRRRLADAARPGLGRRDRRGCPESPPALGPAVEFVRPLRTNAHGTQMDPTNANAALASAFVEELARGGLRQAVVSPGSRSTPLAVALWRQPEIEVTVLVDERSAGFFALGAAQASGEPVALLCTSGTAAANYHPAVCEADESALPLLVLTADRPPELRGIGAGQTIDQVKLYGASVRWFCEVGTHAADDAGLLHYRSTACRALAAARGETPARPGSPQPCPGASRWRRSRSRAR